jgi:hypothetical protein
MCAQWFRTKFLENNASPIPENACPVTSVASRHARFSKTPKTRHIVCRSMIVLAESARPTCGSAHWATLDLLAPFPRCDAPVQIFSPGALHFCDQRGTLNEPRTAGCQSSGAASPRPPGVTCSLVDACSKNLKKTPLCLIFSQAQDGLQGSERALHLVSMSLYPM